VKRIRERLTYANVMSSIAVFLLLGGATAIAAKKIGTKKLKANAVTTGKIKKEPVTTAKIKKDAVTGAKVNEGTLGPVPSATSATTAANLAGQTPFFIRLGFGGAQTIASNGAVSLVAVCDQNAGNDRARILMQTSVDGAVGGGFDTFTGLEGKFLNVGTPPDEREFIATNIESGKTFVTRAIDSGYVLGPEGRMLTANTEGIALGLNYGAAGCLFGGIVNAVG
jgi:hypothetical protein